MENSQYKDNLEIGLLHVEPHAEQDRDHIIDLLTQGLGDRGACLGMLGSTTQAKSLMAWFRDHDLQACKQWAYVAAKLHRMYFQCKPNAPLSAADHLYVLLSDHPDLINWYSQHEASYAKGLALKDRDNPKQFKFRSYQALLALNGRWDELRQRCERILSMDLKRDKRYLIDHRFYLALANGDKAGMESVLAELCSPKVARVRNSELGFGFTGNFIATHATVYAKIAWRHGFELEIDTPWIPREWLPVQPLPRYEDPWPFMQEFDLFQPFEGEWAQWSPKAPN